MFKTHRTFNLNTGVKNNTIAVLNWSNGKNIAVVYHETVVFGKKGNQVSITNGGWDTVSTRAVINRALEQVVPGVYLERRKGKTYLTRVVIDGKPVRTEFTGKAVMRVYA